MLKLIDGILGYLNKIWFQLVISLSILSIFALFICSFIYDKNITLSVMNSWVGLILGIVATLLSIISTLMSFYNLEKTNESNEKNASIMNELHSSIKTTNIINERSITEIRHLHEQLKETIEKIPELTANKVNNYSPEKISVTSLKNINFEEVLKEGEE